MQITGLEVKISSVSTAASSFSLQSVLLAGEELAEKEGTRVSVHMSGNVEGGSAYNIALIAENLPRIKYL